MKKWLILIVLFIECSLLFSQENRYYVRYERHNYKADRNGTCTNGQSYNFWFYIFFSQPPGQQMGFNTSYGTYSYSVSQKPEFFRVASYIQINSNNGSQNKSDDVTYIKGMKPFSISHDNTFKRRLCTRYVRANYRVTVDDPAVINSITFANSSATYLCGTNNIIVNTSKYYGNGRGTAELQILDRNNNWAKIAIADTSGSRIELSYSNVIQYVDLGSPIRLRTAKRLLDNSYSYSTSTKYLYYIPKFKLPDGKDIVPEPPTCYGGETIIKVPCNNDNINYTLTIKGLNNGWIENFETNNLTTVDGYYIISGNFNHDEYELYAETKMSECPTCGCRSSSYYFDVDDIPEFKINSISYKNESDNRGEIYQITKRGGQSEVNFEIENSKSHNVIVELNKTGSSSPLRFTRTLTPATNGYYSGIVTISLSAGEYDNIVVYNDITSSVCYANYSDKFTLKEPDIISFSNIITSPSCNTSNLIEGNTQNGKITANNITGGFGNLTYNVNNRNTGATISGTISGNGFSQTEITSLSSGTYDVRISDEGGNSTTRTVIIQPPSAININIKDTIPPTLSCSSDGSIRIEATGGGGTYLFSKDNYSYTDTTDVVGGYSAGSNKVYVKDNLECVVEKIFDLIVPDALAIALIETTTPTCYDGEDGSCTIVMKNVNGELSAPYAFADSIYISGDTIRIFNLSAGRKEIKIIDTDTIDSSISCPFDITVLIPEKPAINIDPVVINVSDKGSATGKINIGITGGNEGAYNVSLFEDFGMTQQIDATVLTQDSCLFSGLSGTDDGKFHTIFVSDIMGCTASKDVKVFEPNDTLRLSAEIIRLVSCYGDSDAQIQLTATDGWLEGYQYSKDSVIWTTDNVFLDYSAGTHTFYVTDSGGGRSLVNISIGQPSPLKIERDSISHVLCHGSTEGLLRYRISGGTYPYRITPRAGIITESIVNGDTLFTVIGLKAGIYEFMVTDSRNCSTIALKDTIAEPSQLQASIMNIVHTTCELDNGLLSIKASGGTAPYTYILEENGNPLYQQTQNNVSAENAVYFNNLPASSYQITVIDSLGCSLEEPLFVDINLYYNPHIDHTVVNDIICYGQNNGRIQAIAERGSADIDFFTMYNADSTYLESNTTGLFENLRPIDYWIYVYDENGCQSNLPHLVTVNEPEVFAISIDTIMPVITKGEKDGKVYIRIEGGADGNKIVRLKTMDDICVDSISVVNNLQFNMSVYAGTYYMEISDNQTCTVTTAPFEVEEPEEALRFIVTERDDASCKSQTGRFVVEGVGGWGDYRYKRVSEDQYSKLNRFENLYPGSYLVEVTDKMGAVYRESVVIHEPQDSLRAEVVGIQSPTCGGNGNISIKLSGGTYPYTLINEQDTVMYSAPGVAQWQGYENGAMSFYLLDANGCHFELETLIPETSLLKIEQFELKHPNSVDYYSGSIKALIAGGVEPYTYQWVQNFVDMLPENESLLNNIDAGYYTLTVTDAAGCSDKETVYLAFPGDMPFELLELEHETSFEAADGYAVLYADAHLTDFILISPQNYMHELESTDITNNFRIVSDTIYLSELESGKWYIIGGNDDDMFVREFTINPYQEFIFNRTTVIPIASKGDSTGSIKIEIKGGGGANCFTWTNSLNEQLLSFDDEYISTIDELPAGLYTIEVEDYYGNQISKTIEVQEPQEKLTINIVDIKEQDCKNDENAYVVVSASGGWGDYQFRHDSEVYFNNGASFTGLPTRDNYFYLIDKMGVIDSVKVEITEPEYLRTTVALIDSVKCKDASDGNILFGITGGTYPYYIKELDGSYWIEGSSASDRSEGWYTYIFTDENNCIGQDTLKIYVPEPDELLFRDIQITHTTCDLDNGTISVSLEGGTHPYNYSWLDYNNIEIGNDSTITNLQQSGVYTVNVTDINGCTQQFRQLINPSTLPRILQVETAEVLCHGDTTGTARVTDLIAATPYAPYTLTWSNGDMGDYSARFEKGTHYVTIEDENVCSTTYYFNVTEPDALNLNFIDVTEPQCYGYGNGSINTETFGGRGTYNYLWSNGAATANIEHLAKGNYRVEITDGNGCYLLKEITLDEPKYKTLDLGEDISICPGNTVSIDGQDFETYRWFNSTGDLSTQRYLNVEKEAYYFLEATDENGCSVWGDIYVSVGNQALTADLLLPSEAIVGDTLIVFELSNMALDDIEWLYDPDVFERVYVENEYNLFYVAHFVCLQTGIYNIGLNAYADGCYSPVYKQIEILGERDETHDYWGYNEPLITSLTQYPNPTNGEFTVDLELREEAEVYLTLFEIASGIRIDQRSIHGKETNKINYHLTTLNTGTYALIVTAGNERRQIKVIVL